MTLKEVLIHHPKRVDNIQKVSLRKGLAYCLPWKPSIGLASFPLPLMENQLRFCGMCPTSGQLMYPPFPLLRIKLPGLKSLQCFRDNQRLIMITIWPSRLLGICPAAGGDRRQIMALFQRPCYFVFLVQNWCRNPQKAKKWLDYQKWKPK